MQKVHVDDLKVGDYVIKLDAKWLDTPFIKHKFVIKDKNTIDKLKRNGIKHVYLEKKANTVIREAVEERKEQIEEIAEKVTNDFNIDLDDYKTSKEIYQQSISIVHNVMEDVRAGKLFNNGAVKHVADKLVDLTLKNKGVMASIAKLRSYDDYTFQHSMNVSVFATSLAKHMGLGANDIKTLAVSGLLHDVGKMLVPPKILNKPGKLTEEEFKTMKDHVMLGYDYLLKNGFNKDQLSIVVEHHERYDGSGYPKGLKDEEITLFGKIGAVVDIYDAITSNRVYHKRMEPPSALKLMFKWADSHINKKVFEFFVANVGIYPVGTVVLLNSNELAMIANVDKDPLKPVVIVFKNSKGADIPPYLLDTSKKSILQKNVIGPVNPSKIDIPAEVYTAIEDINNTPNEK